MTDFEFDADYEDPGYDDQTSVSNDGPDLIAGSINGDPAVMLDLNADNVADLVVVAHDGELTAYSPAPDEPYAPGDFDQTTTYDPFEEPLVDNDAPEAGLMSAEIDGTTWYFPAPETDTDDDGQADTAVRKGPDSSMSVTDTDDDGQANEAELWSTESGELLARGEIDDQGNWSWHSVEGMSEAVNWVDPGTLVIDPTLDTISGNPEIAEEYWLYQGSVGTCAPTSVAMVLAQILDQPLQSNWDVTERAEELFQADVASDDWSGLTDTQIMVLMESYGVEVELFYDVTIQTLAAYLDAGHAVTVGVDSDEVFGADDDSSDNGTDANHQLVVTGIDQINGIVYLNNPNDEFGPSVIPLEQFLDAWGDDNYSAIVAELPGSQTDISVEDRADLLDQETGENDPYLGNGTPDAATSNGSSPVEATEQRPSSDGFEPFTPSRWELDDELLASSALQDGARLLIWLPFVFVAQRVAKVTRTS